MSLEDAVHAALEDVSRETPTQGAAELALTYARAIDAGGDLDRLGPQLLNVLESLLMTPKARAALLKGAKDVNVSSPVDELRARRAQRAAVHSAAS